jgi:hypothetical protein
MARTWAWVRPVDGVEVGEEVGEVRLDVRDVVVDWEEDEVVVRELGADDAVIVVLLLL